MARYLALMTIAMAMALSSAGHVQAQVILDSGHVDLVPGYDAGWDVKIGYDTLGIDYAVGDAVIRINNNAIAPRPAGSQFDFIGVSAGTPIWRVTQAGFPLLLGIGAEDNTVGTFDTYTESDLRLGATPAERTGEWIRMTVKGFSGPGQMSLWSSDISGPTPFIVTSDGIGPTDVAYALNGSHGDYNWGFTAAGTYQLTLEASAYIGGIQTFSGNYTFTFETQPVPEPSSLALVGVVCGGGLVRRWRNRRRRCGS